MRKLHNSFELRIMVRRLFDLDPGTLPNDDAVFTVSMIAHHGCGENFNDVEAIRIRELAGRYLE